MASSKQILRFDRRLVMALANYDRHLPLIEGLVQIPGIPLEVLEVGQSVMGRHGTNRHQRMLNAQEFDMAEVSLSSFLMAKDQNAPFTAIPVFPRRLFSMSQMWVRKNSKIASPRDLRGMRIGLNTFQTTLSVLAKADLERVYGVPWRNIIWVTERGETRSFMPDPTARIEHLDSGDSLLNAITEGRIDCIVIPHPSQSFLQTADLVKLFRDSEAEEASYYRKFGYFPIMHVIVIRDAVLEEYPDLPVLLYDAFARSTEIAKQRWQDPNWSLLAWGSQAFENQNRLLSYDIWPNGIEKNRENIAWFIEQSLDQHLIRRRIGPSDLFHPDLFNT